MSHKFIDILNDNVWILKFRTKCELSTIQVVKIAQVKLFSYYQRVRFKKSKESQGDFGAFRKGQRGPKTVLDIVNYVTLTTVRKAVDNNRGDYEYSLIGTVIEYINQ